MIPKITMTMTFRSSHDARSSITTPTNSVMGQVAPSCKALAHKGSDVGAKTGLVGEQSPRVIRKGEAQDPVEPAKSRLP